MPTTFPKDIVISRFTIRMGRWSIAGTIIHELAHLTARTARLMPRKIRSEAAGCSLPTDRTTRRFVDDVGRPDRDDGRVCRAW